MSGAILCSREFLAGNISRDRISREILEGIESQQRSNIRRDSEGIEYQESFCVIECIK